VKNLVSPREEKTSALTRGRAPQDSMAEALHPFRRGHVLRAYKVSAWPIRRLELLQHGVLVPHAY